jgi:pimeloyl-ACP methyl ester carboxylesterase
VFAVPSFTSRFVIAADGLRLHARDYGVPGGARTIVCLPGIARTAADFDALARALVIADPGRRVVALDYRGRGLSDRDPNPDHYDVGTESGDIVAVLEALGIDRAAIVGTSRGGIHAMILAVVRPDLLEGVALNDIGPVLEPAGLERIQGYIGKLPQPKTWPDAVAILKGVAGAHFTGLSAEDWLTYAQTTYEERNEGFVLRYDPALMRNFATLDVARLPTMWDQFDALKPVPVLVIRGANSDLLSTATVEAMVARHPDCASLTIPGQGHAPLLTDAPTIGAIDAFCARCQHPSGAPTALLPHSA